MSIFGLQFQLPSQHPEEVKSPHPRTKPGTRDGDTVPSSLMIQLPMLLKHGLDPERKEGLVEEEPPTGA